MFKRHPLLIIFFSGLIIFISGIGTSYYWLTRIYLPEQINTNENARKMYEWQLADSYSPPLNRQVSEDQLNKFLLVNASINYLIQKLKRQFDDSQWQVVFEIIKMQPAWAAQKYAALKKFGLSPLEYDFIAEEISKYWRFRLKEKSAEHLKEFGWEYLPEKLENTEKDLNYPLFNSKEDQLNNLFSIFLNQDIKDFISEYDSTIVFNDSLP